MQLPKELKPDPLLFSNVELRFKSQADPNSLLSVVYPAFADVLPNLTPSKKPAQTQGPFIIDNSHSPEYALSNEQYNLAFGRNVINFDNNGTYPLWEKYFQFIEHQLVKFFRLGLITEIHRIGVRYASMFQSASNFNQVLKTVPSLALSQSYVEVLETIKSSLVVGEFTVTVQIHRRAMVQKKGQSKTGMVIDIDAVYAKPLYPGTDVLKKIDELHTLEKGIFFDLLRPEFIQQLNPKY